MRGAALLKEPCPAPVVSAEELGAAMALRSTTNIYELQTVWFRDADNMTGDVRERLQQVYSQMLARFGALRG